MRTSAVVAGLVLVMGVTACKGDAAGRPAPPANEEGAAGDRGAEVVASQPVLPDESGDEFADIATDRRGLAQVWRRFGLRGAVPEIDFDRSLVLFVGFGESGSCPATFKDVEVQGSIVKVQFGPDGGTCTADYNPRTFVLAVPREDGPRGEFVLELDGGRTFKLAVTQAAQPPPGATIVRRLTSERVALKATADPPSAPRGEMVRFALTARWGASVSTGGWPMALLRWDGRRWLDADGQSKFGDHPSIQPETVTVRPGQRKVIARLGTTELKPGWYSLYAKLQVGGSGGAVEIERPFEVVASR